MDDNRKLQETIEKMQVGGDKKILETIQKVIQYSKEKEAISKLLISKSNMKHNGEKLSQKQAQIEKKQIEEIARLKQKTEAHENAMSILIEKVLSDNEIRERLLDYSVLNDFLFEEKLKERKILFMQEQKNKMAQKGSSIRQRQIEFQDVAISVDNHMIENFKYLPDVIKPEHIRVNSNSLQDYGGKLLTNKDKDKIQHRQLVKQSIQANLNSNKLRSQRAQNLQIINFILHYTPNEERNNKQILNL